jgi:hypothetical protein
VRGLAVQRHVTVHAVHQDRPDGRAGGGQGRALSQGPRARDVFFQGGRGREGRGGGHGALWGAGGCSGLAGGWGFVGGGGRDGMEEKGDGIALYGVVPLLSQGAGKQRRVTTAWRERAFFLYFLSAWRVLWTGWRRG